MFQGGENLTYGEIKVSQNGHSYMDFSMQITAVGIREGSSDKQTNLGSWRSGFDNNLTLLNPQTMSNYTADVVYRVVTVIVSFSFF